MIGPSKKAHDLTPMLPDLRKMWSGFPRLPFNRWTIRPIRWLTSLMPTSGSLEDIRIHDTLAQSGDSKPDVMLRIYQPEDISEPVPALLWMHGGGLVIGNAKMEDAYLLKFVRDLGIVVISVDYRLAPDHPYPAAIHDCYTALKWVHSQAARLRIDPERIAIGGESAGGGLAASLAHLAHDRGEVTPAFQLLVYPMLDDRSALRTDLPYASLMIWTPEDNRFGWESYLQIPAGAEIVPPYAVPARRSDLTGLPPAWIGVGTLDLFYEEDVAYAERLDRSGVECELVVVDGAFHGFDIVGRTLPLARDFRDAQVAALRRGLSIEQEVARGRC